LEFAAARSGSIGSAGQSVPNKYWLGGANAMSDKIAEHGLLV
jgi:hypothetical protein